MVCLCAVGIPVCQRSLRCVCRFHYTMMAWLPTYFTDTLSLSLTQAAQVCSLGASHSALFHFLSHCKKNLQGLTL